MFQRYAIYFTPQGQFAQAGAAWLGWDVAQGRTVAHPEIAGIDLARLTERPRQYGLHGTIKAPFFLADGKTTGELEGALAALCADQSAIALAELEVTHHNGFLALTPTSDQRGLSALATCAVTELDPFRRPPSADELARRRRRGKLTPTQDANLLEWGYPYVLDEFRFHITLTGRIKTDAAKIQAQAAAYFAPVLPRPFPIDSLTLAGQDAKGMFHEINRFALTGADQIS